MSHISGWIHDFPGVSIELSDFIFGEIIGAGMSRTVYEYKPNKQFVIKVESDGKNFQNVAEWHVWRSVQETPLKKWFAPIEDISLKGTFLIQRRASFLERKKYPLKIPSFFNDTKYENFGVIDGKLVCIDYANLAPFPDPDKLRMMRAEWWEGRSV